MSLEMVQTIKEAEAQAEMIKKDAAAQAKQIALDSQKACAALIEAARGQARANRNDALRSADAAAEIEGEVRRAKVASQCEAIKIATTSRINAAVDIVVDRIVRG